MTLEERIDRLERQNKRLARVLGCCFMIIVAVSLVAAADLVNIVVGRVEVKNSSGKTVTTLTSSGDVQIGGSLIVKNVNLGVVLESLQRDINKLKSDSQDMFTESNTINNQKFSAIESRLSTAESQLNKITNGWFLIQSPMQGNVQSYILDVWGGKPDGDPKIQLVGDNNNTPQENRKWRLLLLP